MHVLPPYLALARHYEACFAKHGDTAQGVDWPDAAGADLRYRVMAEAAHDASALDILDLGCGAGHFLAYLRRTGKYQYHYHGLDLSPTFIEFCQRKFPGVPFTCADVLADPSAMPEADYVIMNGLFTERCTLTYATMFEFMSSMLRAALLRARKGIAFNLMSTHVDWQRDTLFHVPYDEIGRFVVKHLSRHHMIRADYGLYEYTVYVYKDRTIHP